MVVHDDCGVRSGSMELGVQEHRGSDVPLTFDDLTVGVEAQDVGRRRLLPPKTPWVAPHPPVVGGDGDVPREILAPALARQDAQRARALLLHGEVEADTGSGPGLTHGYDGIRETLRP